jgi:hypothetical protein
MARFTATTAVRTIGLVCLALLACASTTTAAASTIKTKTKVVPIAPPPVPATNKTKTKLIPGGIATGVAGAHAATLSRSLQERVTESLSLEVNVTGRGNGPNATLPSAPLGADVAPKFAGGEIASPAPSAYPTIPCAFVAVLACIGASLV